MISTRASMALLLTSMIAACGGSVVVDAPGTGGAAPGAGGLGGLGGAGTGGCDALYDSLRGWLSQATTCSKWIGTTQCSGAIVAIDTCGCDVVACDQRAEEASSAVAAFDAWVGAGCGPYECFACPPPPPSPWYCDVNSQKCMPAWEK